ncbi:hypothetical protein AMECASPLE_006831 [Ameca splendens]|uniref:Uncharacterized protein n=1 Tax=Ameca splendens TaxID=208324 RepID=A0ABV0XCK6_9TELE
MMKRIQDNILLASTPAETFRLPKVQGFSIKVCNSACENPHTCPPGPGTDTEEIQATDIQRPPRAQEPQGNHPWDYCNPTREEQGRAPGEPPSSHSVEAPGSRSDEPTGPANSRLRPIRSSHGARDPRPRNISLPKQRPDRAQGSRPQQATTRSEPAHTKAPSPGYRGPQLHRRAETPTTGSSRCRYPIGTTSPRTQKVVPFPPWVESGRLPQHLNLVRIPAPPTPYPNTGGAPGCHPLSRRAHLDAPSRQARPSTKAKPHLNQHCTLPGQDPLVRTPPPNRGTGHQSQGPRSKAIQTITRGPKSQPKHQTTLKNQTPTPAQILTRRPAPSPCLRCQMANRGVVKLSPGIRVCSGTVFFPCNCDCQGKAKIWFACHYRSLCLPRGRTLLHLLDPSTPMEREEQKYKRHNKFEESFIKAIIMNNGVADSPEDDLLYEVTEDLFMPPASL